MEFLKKNYEKVILSVVLLGLVVAAALLTIWVSNERRTLVQIEEEIITTTPKPLKPMQLATNEAAIQALQKPAPLRLSGEHNLFNPVRWQRRPDGSLFPIRTDKDIGPGALAVTRIAPLYTRIEFDAVGGSAESPQYRFKVTREAAKRGDQRATTTRSVTGPGSKNDVFMLKELRPPDNPTEFVLELIQDKQQVVVTREKPYSEVAGYVIDLRYEPEKQTFVGKRVGDSLVFAGDTHKIVAITATAVTVAAPSNKRTTITYKPAS